MCSLNYTLSASWYSTLAAFVLGKNNTLPGRLELPPLKFEIKQSSLVYVLFTIKRPI
jgi:hypothetical protein